jgi:hypothetical protein
MSERKAFYKMYHIKNKAKRNAYSLAYSAEHKEEKKVYDKIYRKAYYAKHVNELKEKMKIYNKAWYAKNAEKRIIQCKKWNIKQYKTNIKFKIKSNMSARIRFALKDNKAGRHWENLVGYTLNDLIKRLKKTLPKGYVWNDYVHGSDLHIDHIIPISAFNFTKPEHTDFQRCWALKNLQLLPALKNMSKGSKLEKPFQPSLLL